MVPRQSFAVPYYMGKNNVNAWAQLLSHNERFSLELVAHGTNSPPTRVPLGSALAHLECETALTHAQRSCMMLSEVNARS